jgi:predicted Zn-dependent protease
MWLTVNLYKSQTLYTVHFSISSFVLHVLTTHFLHCICFPPPPHSKQTQPQRHHMSTKNMQLSPSSGTDISSASDTTQFQYLLKTKFHDGVRGNCSNLSENSSVYVLPVYFWKTHFNIIFSSFQVAPFLRVSHQNPVGISLQLRRSKVTEMQTVTKV